MRYLLLIVAALLGAAVESNQSPSEFYAKADDGSDVVVSFREFQFSTAPDGQESSCEVP